MGQRLQLQTLLESLVPEGKKAYFQPPANVQMTYPCIVYSRDNTATRFAGNVLYFYKKRYQVTVISEDPDSDIPDKVLNLPFCSFQRFFVSNNLNHDVFVLYF